LDALWTAPPAGVLLLGFLPALYVGILVHELGHLAAGLFVGFELRSLSVGVFLLLRESMRWKIRWMPRRVVAGGHTAMVPQSADRLVERYLRFALGGPAASAALLVITAILRAIVPGSAGVRLLFLVDLLIVVSACLPYGWRGRLSDGKQLLLLIRRGPAAEHLAALLYILALDTQRVAPHDWPPTVVERVTVPPKGTPFLPGAISIRYVEALERGDPEWIAGTIEQALSVSADTQPEVRRAFYVAASCFHSQWRNDVANAEAWLQEARQIKGALPREDWDAKAVGLIALAKGEQARAREHLTRYLAMLDRRPASGLVEAERARTARLLPRPEAC
jgi:hypothetical protein